MSDPVDSIIDPLIIGDTVVTATERLSRELTQKFDHNKISLGMQAWESADILPFNAWLKRLWSTLSSNLDTCPVLLDDLQINSLWENIIRDDISNREHETEPLWNTHVTATTAVNAWRILNTWNIDLHLCAISWQADHRCFVRWAKQFEHVCISHNWIDRSRLASRVIDILRKPSLSDSAAKPFPLPAQVSGRLRFSGFDRILPQHQSLIEALEDSGVEVVVSAPGKSINRKVEIQDHENETNQWLSAARWARRKLQNNPEASIAIVAPDLNKAASAIEYALKQILSPQQLAEPGLSTTLPWHISLGKKLAHHPVAKGALIALTPVTGKPLAYESISQLILSPFIQGSDTEAMARCNLELWCRHRLPYRIQFRQLLQELPEPGNSNPTLQRGPYCPILIKSVTAALPLLQRVNQLKPASHWAQRFTEWLDQIGWPGERTLNSDEFQAVNAFQQQLRNLALLDLVTLPISAATAFSWLRRKVNEQPFQVEAIGAPIQVLGVLETSGQQFDAIWFGNLVESEWPPVQRPNPFIARNLQREAGVVEASIELNLEHAAKLQHRLITSGKEVVLARPRMEQDILTEPSPLVTRFAIAAPDNGDIAERLKGSGENTLAEDEPPYNRRAITHSVTTCSSFDTPSHILHAAKPGLEAFTDTHGPAFEQGSPAKGGIAVIEDQAKCPFRAFSIHRLGAHEIEQNEQGLSASERGSLIHQTLQAVWQTIRTSKKLHSLSRDQLHAIIFDAAEQACRRYKFSSGNGALFFRTQTQWAVETLMEWFEIEKRRSTPFIISALEKETSLNLYGLELSFKQDRIDEMEDGSLAVIDYKTGSPGSLKSWSGERPQSPQLPLYAVAQDDTVEAVVYGQVKRGECCFIGVTSDREFDQTDKSPNKVYPLRSSPSLKLEFDNWIDLIEHWCTVLPQLAKEFLDGEARVDPSSANVCTRCDLHGFCRTGTNPDND